MGLFSTTKEPEPVQQDVAPRRSSTLNSRTSSESPRRGGSIFGRHRHDRERDRDSSPDSINTRRTSSTRGTGSGFFHRDRNGAEDASIAGARQRVMDAEVAERDADRALMAAKAAVKDARDQVKALELEAKEEARLAKLKQRAAGDISRRAKPLGKHDKFF
ncbi:hypothetical protein H072_7632 [Dactylellina haptotyla CBS 200.50]|uniref:Uncharacterized protein n=1 Tax=Dactylellina haptotyla (strain CBS 200.50) TaxID=1284197 RepID=S8A730_DACHA|nr:hypothetical protein H072_7632 [Dactylellina haptotyla CBS 200.50]